MNGSKYTFGLNVGLIHIREINKKTSDKALPKNKERIFNIIN